MNKNYKYIEVESSDYVITLWLNRPEVNNAFDENMIDELLSFFNDVSGTSGSRIIVIRGRGNHFSAGADLKWMRNSGKMSFDDNYSGAVKLARLFYTVYNCPLITVALVHGGCYGGANGIVAAADFSFALATTQFVFSEVKLGLVPATIAPYVINKAGLNNSVDWMLSARVIDADEAKNSSLINGVIEKSYLDALIEQLLNNAPLAQKTIKQLIKDMSQVKINEDLVNYTAEITAKARSSEESRKGITAFLEKKKISW